MNKEINTYKKLIKKYNGEKKNCFVLGAGPSLYYNMKEKIFSKLSEYGLVICVNSAIMAKKDCDIWISCDSLCRKWSWFPEYVEKSKCIKIVRNSWLKYKSELEGFLYFSPRPTPEDVINPNDDGLCYASSTPSAIDLSIQCGCKKIFILGLDHYGGNGVNHFWHLFPRNKQPRQNKPAQGPWTQQKQVFSFNVQVYEALKNFAKYKNIKIYNCNPISKMNVFERIKFKNMKEYL